MPPTILYSACIGSALGLYLLMRGTRGGVRGMGTMLALASLAWLLSGVFESVEGAVGTTVMPLICGVIAVMAAVRVATHRRPVFAALYFILVILASAGLFLLLHAEFMAFALVIVYAGAILITYMFVLMLAQQSPSDGTDTGAAWYDRTPREPAIALLAGFILLATLVQATSESRAQHFQTTTVHDNPWLELDRLPKQKLAAIQLAQPNAVASAGDITLDDAGTASTMARLEDGSEVRVELLPESEPTNTSQVGLSLVADFPVSLELAGVILLMAMFGAVVLARRQIELGEDEARAAAGMQPLTPNGGDE